MHKGASGGNDDQIDLHTGHRARPPGGPSMTIGAVPTPPSGIRRALHVARGALPAVLTATLIPLGLFYATSAVAGMKAGIIASLAWAYMMLARQLHATRRPSGLLMITAVTLTVRCLTWALHQTPFTYFSVPVGETIGIAGLFLVTLAIKRPLLISLARDFAPALGDRLAHSSRRRVVKHLSWLWASVYLCSATTSAVLLLTQRIHWFLLMHQISSWSWVSAGLIVTVVYARRHASDLLHVATTSRSPWPADPTAVLASP
jgi:hypothetical protein